MTDIAEFLTARWDELEALARAAHPSPWTAIHGSRGGWTSRRLTEVLGSYTGKPTALHILAHEPAYVLADIAAKRQILALHGTHNECEVCFRLDDESSSIASSQTWENEDAPCDTVRLLAAPFADHPDYDPAWVVT